VVILARVSDEPVATDSKDPAIDGPEVPASADAGPPDPLEEARAEALRMRDQLLRTAADFDNYKKRARRETQDAERRVREDFLRDLLPVFDNLERAAQHAGSASDVKSLAEGISMVMRLFTDTLARLGVERVNAVGQAFDPALHEAVQQLETTEYPAGAVAAEVQAGYRMGDRLVRPAMVVVAKPPPS
jgi:molecular chaperone GrpE